MTSISRDLALPILKKCFPAADNIRIIHSQKEDGQRHLTSDVTRFVVEYKQDGETGRKSVIMKVPTCGILFSFCQSSSLYDREISTYERVLPQINKYLDKSLAPALLHSTSSKILVLEDLTARGYQSGEKFPLLNLGQARAVMKAFAHFHAASHKLYKKNPRILESYPDSNFEGFDFEKFFSPWEAVVIELLNRKKDYRLIHKVEAAILYLDQHKDRVATILDKSKFKFLVLNHGDARKDNFLFKHSGNEVQVQFIDYQCSFLFSPVYDICFFLPCSVSANVLEAHFDDLVDGYLRELNVKLKKLDCGVFDRADFDKDFKKLRFFLLFSFFCLCATVSPINRKQFEDLIDQSIPDITYLCDLCLNDDQFVLPVYRWLKYVEKSNIFDEF